MNGYRVTLNICDAIWDCQCKNSIEKNIEISSTSTQVELQNNYVLNIINVTSNYFTVLIQNGVRTIVRNIYTNYPNQICLPDRCFQHLLTLNGTINEITT